MQNQNPERWRQFHASSPSIFVLDDNEGTLNRLRANLEPLYGENITTMSNPIVALRMIQEAQKRGNPYDILILDLHMPRLHGLEFLKRLGNDAPPTVLHTASMLKPQLADLRLSIERYTYSNALSLLEEHIADRRPAELPFAAVMVALKDQPLSELSTAVDSVLLIRKLRPDTAEANEAFLVVYEPELVPPSITALNVHEISENLLNALNEIVPIINQLKSEGLVKTDWWRRNGQKIEDSIRACEKTFSDFNLETPQIAFSQIHGLINDFMNLEPAGLKFSSILLLNWQNTFKRHSDSIHAIARKLRNHAIGNLMLSSFLEKCCKDNKLEFYPSNLSRDVELPVVSDSDKTIGIFLDNLIRCFGNRNSNSSFSSVSLDFIPESEVIKCSEKEQKAIAKIGAGDCYKINMSDHVGIDFNITFETIRAELGRLLTEKKISWTFTNEDPSYSGISIYLKVTDATFNLREYFDKIKERSANPNEIISDFNGKKDLKIFSEGNNFCLGYLLGELDALCLRGKTDMIMAHVFSYQGKNYVASGFSHKEASATIFAYINLKEGQTPLTTDDIYKQGTRLTIMKDNGVNIEPGTAEQENLVKSVLLTLGILETRMVVSNQQFPYPKQQKVKLGSTFFDKEVLSNIIEVFGEDIISNPLHSSTIDKYTALFNLKRKIDEPSFIIRTRVGITLDQQRIIAEQLIKTLKQVGSYVYRINESRSEVSISGNLARKAGIYLFDSRVNREVSYSGCPFESKLSPFVERSQTIRLFSENIVKVGDEYIPDNSLVYGGGDHSIHMCQSQATISCALEIIYQKLSIPYDICRGIVLDGNTYEHFNGQGFEFINTKMFI